MMRKSVYIAHRFNDCTERGRSRNRGQAAKWAKWARDQGYSPSCSWITLTWGADETPEGRAVGLECDVAQVVRCDELWLCGPVVSPGMLTEEAAAREAGVPVFRLLTRNPAAKTSRDTP